MSVATITEDEAALYDRQIRLWGLDAQKRMRASDVLVIGANGLTGEVMKNIVLAGINSLTILDDDVVREDHLSAMFIVNKSHLGQKVAEASLEAIRKLNPLVKVTADVSHVMDKPVEFFKQFHIVCMSSANTDHLIHVDSICSDHNINFFTGAVFGFYGYFFSNLGQHEYAEEMKVPKKEEASEEAPSSAKKPKLSNNKTETETVTVRKSCQFERLKACLDVDWSKVPSKQLKKICHVYFIIRALLDFTTKMGRRPILLDAPSVVKQCTATMTSFKLDPSLLVDKFCASMACGPEMSPVCAIVGGVLGQEILKAVSQKDAPHNNYFFFDPETNAGVVESIHSATFILTPTAASQQVEIEEEIL